MGSTTRFALACALVLLAGLWPGSATAEVARSTPRFGHLDAEEGLSSSWVLSVLRDSRGFLWVGTQNGLNRYDGCAFVTYQASAEDPHSIPSPIAGVLFEDRRGRLWVGSGWGAEGMARYDRDLDRFVRLSHGAGSGGMNDGRVNAIVEDDRGILWVGTRAGVERVDTEQSAYETFPFEEQEGGPPPPRMATSLLWADRTRLWVGTTEGLFLLDPAGHRCVRWLTAAPEMEALLRARVAALLQDDEGTIWVGTLGEGLFQIDSQGGMKQHLPRPGDPASLSHPRVRCLALDGEGALWVGTENGGLNRLDRRRGAFHRYLPDPLDPQALGSASLYALLSDPQGILWVGTYNRGLDYIAPAEQRFGLVRASHLGLRDSHVSALLEDRHGNLWIGTDGGGLSRVDARTGRFSYLMYDPSDARSIGSSSVLTLAEDDAGAIWVGGWEGGLSRLDPATGKAHRFRHDAEDVTSLVGDDVWQVRQLPSGELLVATQQGPDLFDPQTGRFTRLWERYPGVHASMTEALEVTAGGDFWIGQSGRLQHVAAGSGVVTTYQEETAGPSHLPGGMVFAILEDGGGNTWIGGERGLFRLPSGHPPGSELVRIEGLPHETVTNVLEDASGNVWVTTHRGLSRLTDAVQNPTQPSMVHFDVNDGLQGNEFSRGAATRGSDGRLYFGGPRGFNLFDPEKIRLNTSPPPVVLTDLRIFNRSVAPGAEGSPLLRSITETSVLTLSPEQLVVTFEFAALNLDLPAKNRYAYRLEGLEDDWNDSGTRREATYTQLRPGPHVLRVRAANNDGVWNQQGLSLRLEVLPRWHERWWARLLFVGLAAAGVVVAYRRRLHQLLAREAELARRVEDRTRDLNQLNEQLEQRVVARTLELEEEKELLAVTLRSIGDGVIATDVDSRVVLFNRVAEQVTGWAAAEARGRRLAEILPLRDGVSGKPLPDPVADVLDGEAGWLLPLQGVFVRRGGGERVLSLSVAAIRDQRSRTVGAVLVLRDITERRRMDEQLQNTQKLEALGILAGGIAHDFNNLLTGVFGYLEVMRRRWADRPKDAETLAKAAAVLEKARGLTGQLLTFSKGGEPVTAPLDLEDLLRKSLDFTLSGSNVVGTLDVPNGLWACRGDRRQIDQVIDNLLLNARQAMPEGGTIEVLADNVVVTGQEHLPVPDGRYVRLTVTDQGSGIPAELRSRVFEPFFSTKKEGSGLGLATSYSIVRKHGGHIDVQPGPGRGATLVVYLPASEEEPPASREAVPEGGVPRCRVLVMDDETYVRDVIGELLESLGHEVVTVAGADEAIEVFRREHESGRSFDTVMLDLTIPGGMGGRGVLARMKEIDPQVRAVASSGYSGDPVMADPTRHGFVAQLHKPYTVEDLRAVLARVCSRPGRGPHVR